MVATDVHAKWPKIIELSNTTSSKTIQELRKWLAAYGLPQQVVTDNGPQFTSTKYSYFMKSNGIKHQMFIISPVLKWGSRTPSENIQTVTKSHSSTRKICHSEAL